MILIGQYDSPFVRRVGIALTLYGMAFEHRPWSVFGETEKIRPLQSAGARADPGPRRRRGADGKPQHSRLSRQFGRPRARAVSGRRAGAAQGAAGRRTGDGHRRKGRQPVLREAPAQRGLGRLGRAAAARRSWARLPCSRPIAPARPGDYWFGDQHRPCRHRGRRRAALHCGSASPGWCRCRTFRRLPPTPRGWKRCRCSRRFRSRSSRRREHSCAIKGCGNLPMWHKMTQYQYIASSVSRHCADRPLISNHSDVRLM